ncbi:MAG: class II aldolase/adducin family protein [Hyphomicrobiales bacterium]|nr:class II aldolase/adducin family protein [Hyphomicrobiales bacterium]
MRELSASGLNRGASGNVSLRFGEAMLISPSATPPSELTPDLVAKMDLARDDGAFEGPRPPSTEWRFHRDILRSRPDANAVVHTHSPYATVLAILRREIPAVHYMIAGFGGSTIRCADYATFGTAELSAHALVALEGRNGCLLANHGSITLAPTMARALWLAVELETLAFQYQQALMIGEPVILSDAAIAEAAAKFANYGRR